MSEVSKKKVGTNGIPPSTYINARLTVNFKSDVARFQLTEGVTRNGEKKGNMEYENNSRTGS